MKTQIFLHTLHTHELAHKLVGMQALETVFLRTGINLSNTFHTKSSTYPYVTTVTKVTKQNSPAKGKLVGPSRKGDAA